MPAQAMAQTIIVSAIRFVDVRHSDRVRKNSAETNVPPDAIAIHHTYNRIGKPHMTGQSLPNTETPNANSQATETTPTPSSATDTPRLAHHHIGVCGRSAMPQIRSV